MDSFRFLEWWIQVPPTGNSMTEPKGRRHIAGDLGVPARVRSLWHLSPRRALTSPASRWRDGQVISGGGH